MIRPSGGRLVVKVRRQNTIGNGMRPYLARNLGPWVWEIPEPKGHPRKPKWDTLRGRAHSMEEAVADGLRRMATVYRPTDD